MLPRFFRMFHFKRWLTLIASEDWCGRLSPERWKFVARCAGDEQMTVTPNNWDSCGGTIEKRVWWEWHYQTKVQLFRWIPNWGNLSKYRRNVPLICEKLGQIYFLFISFFANGNVRCWNAQLSFTRRPTALPQGGTLFFWRFLQDSGRIH